MTATIVVAMCATDPIGVREWSPLDCDPNSLYFPALIPEPLGRGDNPFTAPDAYRGVDLSKEVEALISSSSSVYSREDENAAASFQSLSFGPFLRCERLGNSGATWEGAVIMLVNSDEVESVSIEVVLRDQVRGPSDHGHHTMAKVGSRGNYDIWVYRLVIPIGPLAPRCHYHVTLTTQGRTRCRNFHFLVPCSQCAASIGTSRKVLHGGICVLQELTPSSIPNPLKRDESLFDGLRDLFATVPAVCPKELVRSARGSAITTDDDDQSWWSIILATIYEDVKPQEISMRDRSGFVNICDECDYPGL